MSVPFSPLPFKPTHWIKTHDILHTWQKAPPGKTAAAAKYNKNINKNDCHYSILGCFFLCEMVKLNATDNSKCPNLVFFENLLDFLLQFFFCAYSLLFKEVLLKYKEKGREYGSHKTKEDFKYFTLCVRNEEKDLVMERKELFHDVLFCFVSRYTWICIIFTLLRPWHNNQSIDRSIKKKGKTHNGTNYKTSKSH